jgi:ribosome-binding ATPase YchF (GTP1/OBG family)
MASGSMAESRKRGQLRQEGRTYDVKDGDIVNILFSR